MEKLHIQPEYQQVLLLAGLKRFFGDFDEALLERVLPHLEWMQAASGELIFKAGEPGDDLYFVVSGRLRATADDGNGGQRLLGEVMRGESVGEMAVISGEPRSATVTAVRASVLVRLRRRQFQVLLTELPRMAQRMMRLIIERLSRSNTRAATRVRPENIVLLPITIGVNAYDLAKHLATRFKRQGRTLVLTRDKVAEKFGAEAVNATREQPEHYLALSRWLDEVESQTDFLLLVADAEATSWTERCLSHADEILLLANAHASPRLAPVEASLLSEKASVSRAGRRLVLVHEREALSPHKTHEWLGARDLIGHVHIRRGIGSDTERLARIVSGTAVGLVLSGGGARGFAHLGVYRALREAGIEIDYVGGTSMGAVIASLVAMDIPPREAINNFREVFKVRPLSDFNAFPIVSLISGKKLEGLLARAYGHLMGGERDMEDCWKTFYCVASSYSYAREVVLTRGPLLKMLRASLSIPAFFPPVYHNGEALVDGAIFNNFPTDIMARMGVGRLIGVDLGHDNFGPVSGDNFPGPWQVLLNVFRRKKNRVRVPLIGGMLFRAPLLYSKARQNQSAEMVDLLLKPDLRDIGMLDWKSLDAAVEVGYRCTREQLARLKAEARPAEEPAKDEAAAP